MQETEDIVTRLERDVLWLERRSIAVLPNDLREAATTIATLRAEVEGLRADAERWRYFVRHCEWFRHDAEDGKYSRMSIRLPYESNQSCIATRNAAIDAAKAGKEGA